MNHRNKSRIIRNNSDDNNNNNINIAIAFGKHLSVLQIGAFPEKPNYPLYFTVLAKLNPIREAHKHDMFENIT